MDSKKVIAQLIKIAEKQQKIIEKLAQQVGMEPAAQKLAPVAPKQQSMGHEAQAVLNALPPNVKAKIAQLEIHGSEVYVRFGPQGGTDQDFNAVIQTVNNLAQQNMLPAKQYQVKEY